MVEVFEVEDGLEGGRVRAVDGGDGGLGLGFTTNDGGGGGDSTSARAYVNGAVGVVGEDVFSID